MVLPWLFGFFGVFRRVVVRCRRGIGAGWWRGVVAWFDGFFEFFDRSAECLSDAGKFPDAEYEHDIDYAEREYGAVFAETVSGFFAT